MSWNRALAAIGSIMILTGLVVGNTGFVAANGTMEAVKTGQDTVSQLPSINMGWGARSKVAPIMPQFRAEAAVLIEAETGRILAARNEERRMHPASTTKMVTLLTALTHYGTRFDELAKISPYATSMEESNLGVKVGDQLPLQSVAEGMMVASGNDAAVVVAEAVSGSVYRFSLEMNEVAKAAGATNSHFLNPHGLTQEGHYSTALDLARIAAYGMNIPMFRDMVGFDYYTVGYQNRTPVTVRTTNHFIRSHYEGANGLKTGYTEAAGDCLIASATRNGHTLIVVLLNDDYRWDDAPALLDYGFALLESEQFDMAVEE